VSTRSIAIITSLPDIACAVCGRRLLRGEHPDVFLAGGRRRNVCELCAPRAVDEGWLREHDGHSVSPPPARQRRGRSLLERLRQLKEPARHGEAMVSVPVAAHPGTGTHGLGGGSHYSTEPEQGALEPDSPVGHPAFSDHPRSAEDEPGLEAARAAPAAPFGVPEVAPGWERLEDALPRSGELKAQRALEVFNAGEHPRRVVGIARSLGVPGVSVRPLGDSGSKVAIVIAWELCWYRYLVDLADEDAGASVVGEGTELSELNGDDRPVNANAAEDGRLSLIESLPQ
jgi:hypothetical protein